MITKSFAGWRKASVGTQSPESVSRDDEGFVKTIRWVFPVHGIPEVRSDRSKGININFLQRFCTTNSGLLIAVQFVEIGLKSFFNGFGHWFNDLTS